MSATPITRQIRVLDAGSWKVDVEEGQVLAACNVDLLRALLAVAKGIVSDFSDLEEDELGPSVVRAMKALDAAHPGWRQWTP